jgi:two-component system nitrogen regulation response regulator GlnG
LARHFLAAAEREGLPAKTLDPEAVAALQRHRWPGNVRELENLVRRLTALYPQERISAPIVENEIGTTTEHEAQPTAADDTISSSVERHMARYFAEFADGLPPAGLYQRVLREVEAPLIHAALAATRGNQIRAADLLGLNRNTLRKKIRELDIHVARRRT